ncbi:MAG TPA: prepilin-type N-terminal cleavage/methylation domain-containing protein [Nevskiaceae bacterium]|nr:prepilin-type N-terminal cleavage/methylation domain-containing protein [Nevskiaceae bacterium]
MRREKGQSLIEVLVALAVMAIVILALVRVTTVSIRNATFAKNRALATKYAQEGMEKVRAYRDEVVWETFTSNCPPTLDALPLPFTRTVACTGSGDERDIIVIVSWSEAGIPHESKLVTHLTNWK